MRNFLQQKNKGHKILSSSKGFTLVESLVAISIFSLSILGMMSVLSQNLTRGTYAKNKIIAAYLAQEGLEYVRNVRDSYALLYGPQTGWINFSAFTCDSINNACGYNAASYPGYVCTATTPTCKLYVNNGSYDSNVALGTDSGFTRKIWLNSVSANEKKITVNVSWTQGSQQNNVTFSENVFNWIE